jgi:hypothetical protein
MQTSAPMEARHAARWRPTRVEVGGYHWRKLWRFPVRPQPYADESIAGYLARVAHANGYESIQSLKNAALRKGAGWLAMLAKGLRLPGHKLTALNGSQPKFNHHYVRWCPECLVEQPYLRAAWTKTLSCLCIKHRSWLHDTCYVCGERQTQRRADFERCRCGARLSGAVPSAAPDSVLKVQAAIQSERMHEPSAESIPDLSAYGWDRLIRYLGQFEPGIEPTRPGQIAGLYRLEVASRLLMSVAELLTDWPSQFEALLVARQRVSARSASIQKTYGLLYRTIYKDLAEAEFQFLRDAFEDHLNRRWWGTINRRNRRLRETTINAHPKLTLKQIARESKLQPALIRTFVRRSQIKSEGVRFPSGRTTQTVSSDQVDLLRKLGSDLLDLRQAAKCLGLSRERVRMLIDAGVLTLAVDPELQRALPWRIQSRSVESLLGRIVVGRDIDDGTSLRTVLKTWRLKPDEFVALVQAIREGHLIAYHAYGSSGTLGDSLLSRGTAHAWLTKRRTAEGQSISVDQAATALGLKQEVTYQLVRRGLISAQHVPQAGFRVCLESLQRFQLDYVSLSELSARSGKSPRRLLRELTARPVTGPQVDGARQYFFRRTEIFSQEEQT